MKSLALILQTHLLLPVGTGRFPLQTSLFVSDLGPTLPARLDGLPNAAVLMSGLILAVGVTHLGLRTAAAIRGSETLRSLLAHRLVAILGALCGFGVYLRDLPQPGAPRGLTMGGLSAAPWVAVVVLERLRRVIINRRTARIAHPPR